LETLNPEPLTSPHPTPSSSPNPEFSSSRTQVTAVENCLLALETVCNQSLRDVLRGKRSELEAKRRELERAAGDEDLSSRMVDAIRDCVERSSGLLRGIETGLD